MSTLQAKTTIVIGVIVVIGCVAPALADNLYRANYAGVADASGNWSEVAKWTIYDATANPQWGLAERLPTAQDTVKIYGGITVTGDLAVVTCKDLYIGASSTTTPSKFYMSDGRIELTKPSSLNPLEIGYDTSRTAESIIELEDVDADFGDYRLVVGRDGGNAHYIQRGGSLATPDVLIGIGSSASAAPNTIYLENVSWTNRAGWNVGYSSCNTNIVQLNGGGFVTTKSFGFGNNAHTDYTAGTADPGEDFFIAENANISMNIVYMPNCTGHNSHLMLSNCVAGLTQILSGNVSGSTNEVVIDGCDVTSVTKHQIGYKQDNTVNRFAVRHQKSPKTSAKTIFEKLTFNPTSNYGVDTELEFTDSDFEDYSSSMYIVNDNDRGARKKWTFSDMTVPPVQLAVNTKINCLGSTGELVLSNAVWDTSAGIKALYIANAVGTKAAFRAYGSRLVGGFLPITDNADAVSHDTEGEVYISGGNASFSSIYVRRGVGRFVLDNGAVVTNTGTAYFPNHTGARSTFELRNGAEFIVPAVAGSGFLVGNQAGTYSTILINGGILNLKDASTVRFGYTVSNCNIVVNSGLVDLGTNSAPFATYAGAHGRLELNGGTWISSGFGTPRIGSDQKIVFNGGVFKAPGSCSVTQERSITSVGNGGAIFDTDGAEEVNVYSVLAHDENANAIDGGLVKRGEGCLCLRAVNTFTGPITVEGGSLAFGVSEALPDNCTVTLKIADGAFLNRSSAEIAYPEGMVINAQTQALDSDQTYKIASLWSGALPTVILPNG